MKSRFSFILIFYFVRHSGQVLLLQDGEQDLAGDAAKPFVHLGRNRIGNDHLKK